MENPARQPPNPWRWIPSLYFAQGIPYVAVMTLSVVMYKNLGVSNTDIALYTSWLYLPWVIKPLWSPVVDLVRTKRLWIVGLQLVVGAALAAVALTLPGPGFFRATLVVFWLLAFSSATHDIAADGFYLLALPPHQQAAFVGVRSLFYRLAMIFGQGGLVYAAGKLTPLAGGAAQAWVWVFGATGAFFLLTGAYHQVVLPRPTGDGPARIPGLPVRVAQASPPARPTDAGGAPALPGGAEFFEAFASFFRKPEIGRILAFLLLYRLAEAQLLKLVQPFLLDARETGGLGLATEDVGVAYGTVGVTALIVGGLLGGYLISRYGLKRMLWPMVAAINLPNLVYVWLALVQPVDFARVRDALAIEQFGYGFGFTAYMVYMMLVAEGPHRTVHYSICTGFMALGMMLPGMWSGWLQTQLGYVSFFVWVCVATLASFAVTAIIRVDPAFGKKT